MPSSDFHRQYLTQLPLPLAQLYRRTNDEKSNEARHNVCYFMFEAAVKLVAAPAVALYLEEVEHDQHFRVAQIDQLLEHLACPSQGHWVGILRELARYFSNRPDAKDHPLGSLWDELKKKRKDLDGVIDLYRNIKNGPNSVSSGDQSCSLLEVYEKLVSYRNMVLGHGGHPTEAFYQEKAPLFLPAVNDAVRHEVLSKLWPKDARLIYVNELRQVRDDRFEMEYKELTGERGLRMPEIAFTPSQARAVGVKRVALIWPGRVVPLRLNPLLKYHEIEQNDEVLFLNKDVRGKRVEHLSYTTGTTHLDKDEMVAEMRRLLSRVKAEPVSPSGLDRIIEKSMSDIPKSISDILVDEYGPAPGPPSGRTIGDFEVLATIGRGGMGVVYLARQLSLGRLVALKTLPAFLARNEVALARFQREIRILGQCEHPNIVKILAHGTTEDHEPYYVMEYVPGCDFSALCDAVRQAAGEPVSAMTSSSFSEAVYRASQRQREAGEGKEPSSTVPASKAPTPASNASTPPVDQIKIGVGKGKTDLLPPLPKPSADDHDRGGYIRHVVTMIRDAARALQHVHDKEIIHRDIKPANLMLTPDASRVVLMDFGLARLADSDMTQEQHRNRIGTLRYMSPEQLQVREINARVDVRALGVTLWQLLTRQQIFEDITEEEPLRTAILDDDVPRLRSIDPAIPKDLDAIVARATERKPADRINSAKKLADYLDNYLLGQEIPIRPRTAFEKAMRWAGENKLVSGSAVTSAVVIVVALFVSLYYWQQEAIAREQTRVAEENARDTVNEYFVDVSENVLLNQPGLKTVRDKLLQQAKTYYVEFLKNQNTPELQLEIAKTHYRVGVVTKDLEGPEAALKHYQSALDLLDRLPKSEERDLYRSFALNRLGEAHQSVWDKSHDAKSWQTAEQYYKQAEQLRTELVTEYAKPEYHRLHANSLMNLGQLAESRIDQELWAGSLDSEKAKRDYAEARSYLDQAQDIRSKQIEAGKADAETLEKLRRDYGKGYYNLGKLDDALGVLSNKSKDEESANDHFKSARKNSVKAAELIEELRVADLLDTELTELLALANQQLGGATRELAYFAAKDLETAEDKHAVQQCVQSLVRDSLAAFQKSGTLFQGLVRQNPTVDQYRRDLAVHYDDLGMTFQEEGHAFGALYCYELARKHLEPIKAKYKEDYDTVVGKITLLQEQDRFEYAKVLGEIGQLQSFIGNEPSATEKLKDCVEQLEMLVTQTSSDNQLVEKFVAYLTQLKSDLAQMVAISADYEAPLKSVEGLLDRLANAVPNSPGS